MPPTSDPLEDAQLVDPDDPAEFDYDEVGERCRDAGHPYAEDHVGIGRCHCHAKTYPAGGHEDQGRLDL